MIGIFVYLIQKRRKQHSCNVVFDIGQEWLDLRCQGSSISWLYYIVFVCFKEDYSLLSQNKKEASCGRVVRLACDESELYRLSSHTETHPDILSAKVLLSSPLGFTTIAWHSQRRTCCVKTRLLRQLWPLSGTNHTQTYFEMSEYHKRGAVSTGVETWFL
jgi:hypothetical protein